jgi:hypothetical protein
MRAISNGPSGGSSAFKLEDRLANAQLETAPIRRRRGLAREQTLHPDRIEARCRPPQRPLRRASFPGAGRGRLPEQDDGAHLFVGFLFG